MLEPYATLSHCWGEADMLKLTEKNKEELENNIDLRDLPRTFVEAIEIARRLAIPYLWIDSLCIIQDSLEDWKREASLNVVVQKVYGYSRLNIMATASSNSHQGLFRDRDPRAIAMCRVTTSWDDEDRKEAMIIDKGAWRDQILQAPLIQRGWVVQERILPPRALHFGQTQLFWECNELDACEEHPTGLPWGMQEELSKIKTLDPDAWYDFCDQKYRQEDIHDLNYKPPPCPRAYAGYDLWSRIVEYYTMTKLTYESDKLIAVSGLAQKMGQILDDEYLAGLWLRFLPSQLLWTVRDETCTNRTLNYQAPSWSWASVDGGILMPVPRDDIRHLVDLEDHSAQPVTGHNNAGMLSMACIKLKGTLLSARIRFQDRGYSKPYNFELSNGGYLGRSRFAPDLKPSSETPLALFLPVEMTTQESASQTIRGLILEKAEGQDRGWYRRLGYIDSERGSGSYSERGSGASDEEWPMFQAMKDPTMTDDGYYLEEAHITGNMAPLALEKSSSPEPAAVTDSKKRKSQVEEIEVDLALPEPPSKKAKRLLKKGKPLPVKPNSDDEAEKDDGLDIPSAKAKDGKDKKSKRSEYGIWIGNLPFTLTRVELFKWLVDSSGGVIQEVNITRVNLPKSKLPPPRGVDQTKPQNKGFAYVDFDTEAAAVAAMSLTETQMEGRNVLIKSSTSFEGRPQKEAEDAAAASQAAGARPGKPEGTRKIYVGNLPFQATEDDIWAHFEKCGVIDWVKVATFEDTGKCKGYGWVKFKEAESAESAVKGFVRIKEEIETEDDFRESKDGEGEEPAEEKKFKTRKWWVNRIRGRDLKIEFAEDDQVRYKKRFGKDKPPRPQQNGEGSAQEKETAKPTVAPKKTTFED
ncbi:putative RRM domain-containing protein [Seiridium unicorne]|uniref:RRM domain-containing protein n=1 Tax=Seiridium unicorne TaxID=138068 RepID=A0ABR2UEJ7_9PEZI